MIWSNYSRHSTWKRDSGVIHTLRFFRVMTTLTRWQCKHDRYAMLCMRNATRVMFFIDGDKLNLSVWTKVIKIKCLTQFIILNIIEVKTSILNPNMEALRKNIEIIDFLFMTLNHQRLPSIPSIDDRYILFVEFMINCGLLPRLIWVDLNRWNFLNFFSTSIFFG